MDQAAVAEILLIVTSVRALLREVTGVGTTGRWAAILKFYHHFMKASTRVSIVLLLPTDLAMGSYVSRTIVHQLHDSYSRHIRLLIIRLDKPNVMSSHCRSMTSKTFMSSLDVNLC